MPFNPNILRKALSARSLTSASLSRRLNLTPEELTRELARTPEPKAEILKKLAKELSLPELAFFRHEEPDFNEALTDFRSAQPHPTVKQPSTIESIQLAESIQSAASDLDVETAHKFVGFNATKLEQVGKYAEAMRRIIGPTLQEQAAAKDTRSFFALCRKYIEDRRIFVLQDSFPSEDGSGFCLATASYPVIVVNTSKQTHGRRLFTLIHELAHVLRRQSGFSDPFVTANQTERLCNQFAACFLVPQSFVRDLLHTDARNLRPTADEIAAASRRLKISQQATAIRLEELGIYADGTHERWLKSFETDGNPDFTPARGGGGNTPPERTKLAKYGFRFASAFGPLIMDGTVTELSLFRLSGLKPKYQRAYFDFAASLGSGQLGDLELDDD